MEYEKFIEVNRENLFEYFDKKSILIAGCSGVVGTAWLEFSQKLLFAGIDAKFTCVSYSGRINKQLSKLTNVEFIRGDITDSGFTSKLGIFDHVVHAAGYGQPAKFTSHPIQSILTSTVGTANLIQQVSTLGAFIYYSSSEVYAGLPNGYFEEVQIGTSTPEHTRAAYIEGKRCGEAMINSARIKMGTQGLIFRLALAHGPGSELNDERVLNSFIRSALVDKNIEMKDRGNAVRIYCSSRDAVLLSVGVLIAGSSGTFNIGGIHRLTIRELAEHIGVLTNSHVSMPEHEGSFLAEAPAEVSLSMRKTLKIMENFDYDSTEIALRKTIDWYKTILENHEDNYTII